ncbi:MAG: hypothetical protein KIS92_02350 [Planctomycetota bacterium]|nr:hypothetical protein [Planctomycetota bacterium]
MTDGKAPDAFDAFDAFVRRAGSAATPPPGLRDRIRARLDAADREVASDLDRQALHAFLDGQLPPGEASKVRERAGEDPNRSKEMEAERAFLAMVKKASARTAAPEGFRERLAGTLGKEYAHPPEKPAAAEPAPAVAPVPPAKEPRREAEAPKVVRGHFGRRAFLGALAACVLAAAGVYIYQQATMQCPYILGCVDQHRAILEGKEKLAVAGADPEKIVEFVRANADRTLAALPDLSAFGLEPVGAGIAPFSNLPADWKAPQGAYVELKGPQSEVATLIVHPWLEEEPMDVSMKMIAGRRYWFADHHGYRAAGWKLKNGVLVILVSKRSMDEIKKLAVKAYASMEPQSAALESPARPPL